MTREVKLKLPSPQNFIILDLPMQPRSSSLGLGLSQNIPEQPSMPIENLSEAEAEQYAEELKQQFLNHYKFRKNNPSNTSSIR